MKKERREESFLRKPWYKGGGQAMSKFIAENLKYPEEARNNKVEGKVRLRLSIDYLGGVVEAKVQSGLGHGCDEEAVRVAKLLKFEVAKTPRKLKVVFHRVININFNLNKSKRIHNKPQVGPSSQPKQFVYNVVVSKKKDKPIEEKPKSNTFSYTLKINP